MTDFNWSQYDQDTEAQAAWIADDQAREAAGLPQESMLLNCPTPQRTPLEIQVHDLAQQWYDLQAARLENTDAGEMLLSKIRLLQPSCGLLPENSVEPGYCY